MFGIHRVRRALLALTLAGSSVTLSACDSMLEVNNAGALNEDEINDPLLVTQMMTGAMNRFQENLDFLVFAGAILGDEAVNGQNYEEWKNFDLRIVVENNLSLPDIYESIQGARGHGDEMVNRIRQFVNDTTSMELATALTYTGYGYIYLAEYFCFAPVEPTSPAIRSDSIAALAVVRFKEAIDIASRSAGTEPARILNLARVGAARASLQQNRKAEAIAFATPVPASFTTDVKYVETPTGWRNYLQGAVTGTNHYLGVDTAFRFLNDRRVRHNPVGRTGHNQMTLLYTPYLGPSHGGWNPAGSSTSFVYTTSIRLASGLEARYIIAEAGGMTDADLLAFINERRAVGGQPVPFTGTNLQAELRDQRRRDFFLDGHRLGDLRRYRTRYQVDQFPKGAHPNNAQYGWGDYGTATCFIPHQDERIGNPNYTPLELDP